jgi:hypothetical protein
MWTAHAAAVQANQSIVGKAVTPAYIFPATIASMNGTAIGSVGYVATVPSPWAVQSVNAE